MYWSDDIQTYYSDDINDITEVMDIMHYSVYVGDHKIASNVPRFEVRQALMKALPKNKKNLTNINRLQYALDTNNTELETAITYRMGVYIEH